MRNFTVHFLDSAAPATFQSDKVEFHSGWVAFYRNGALQAAFPATRVREVA